MAESGLDLATRVYDDLKAGVKTGASAVAQFTNEEVARYKRFLGRVIAMSAAGIGFGGLLYYVGVVTKSPWLLSASTVVAGVIFAFLIFAATPVLAGYGALAQISPAVRWGTRLIGGVILGSILVALLLSVVPFHERAAHLLTLGSIALGLIVMLGNAADHGWIRRRIFWGIAFSVLVAFFTYYFPNTAGLLSDTSAFVDTGVARFLRSYLYTNRPVEVRSLSEFRALPLFDKANQPLLWYAKRADGDYEFFRSEGVHPRTGESLKPVTPDVARDAEKWLAAREAVLAPPRSQVEHPRAPSQSSSVGQGSRPDPKATSRRIGAQTAPVPVVAVDPQRARQDAQRGLDETIDKARRALVEERETASARYRRNETDVATAYQRERVEIERQRQVELMAIRSRIDVVRSVGQQIPLLGAVSKAAAQQEQANINARARQALLSAEAESKRKLGEAREALAREHREAQERFEGVQADARQRFREVTR
jgi:hypothetical protein